MISFKTWMSYHGEQRREMLKAIAFGDEDIEILEEIDPSLRVENVEGIANWPEIQTLWISSNRRTRTHSALSIETAEQFLARLEDKIEKKLKVSDDNFEKPIQYSGWNQGLTLLSNTVGGGPDYLLFEDFNVSHGLIRRFMVQPNQNNFQSYSESIMHLINHNPIIVDNAEFVRTSITFEVYDENIGITPFTFSSSMGWDNVKQNIGRIMNDNDVGSGRFMYIRENIVRVFVNIISPSRGAGLLEPQEEFELYYDNFVITKCYTNIACFYWCIRKIKKTKTQNTTLRKTVFDTPPSNFDMPISIVKTAFDRLDVNVILLCNQKPKTELIRNTIRYKTYEDIRYKYMISFECYYYPSNDGVWRIFSDNIPVIRSHDECGYVMIDGKKYFLMIYENNHYDIVRTINMPRVCDKCGSNSHDSNLARIDETTRSECLTKIREEIGDVIVRNNIGKTKIIIFDAETVPINGYHHPYMVSYQVCDLETQELIFKDTISSYDCFDKFLDVVFQYTGTKYLIGYNSSSFDNYFVMRSMLKYNFKLSSENVILYHNKILRMNIKGIVTWDLYQFTKSSLRDACVSYSIGDHKDEVDHDKISSLFQAHKFTTAAYSDKEFLAMKVKEYCEKDVEVTKKLFFVIYKDLVKITNINPLSKSTLSSLAYTQMQKYWKSNDVKIEKIPMEYNEIFTSIPGGRTQVFKKGVYHGNFVLLDVNALYPYTCIENTFPISAVMNGMPTNADHIYLALCKVDQTKLQYKMLGEKDGNDRLNWNKDIVTQWIWKEQLEVLKEHGCPVEVIKAIHWEESAKIFGIMEYYKKVRNESADNVVRGKLSKGLSNINTGKLIENNHTDVWEICNHQTSIDRFIKKYNQSPILEFELTGIYNNVFMKAQKEENAFINKPRHIGSRIYALSRLYMWKLMMKCNELYYSDTDSLLIKKEEMHKFPIGKEYGELKIEDYSNKIIVVSPKTYIVNKKKGLKGYKIGDKWQIMQGDKILEEGVEIKESMYEALLDNTKHVITKYHNIQKKFVRRSDTMWELLTISGENTEKILA